MALPPLPPSWRAVLAPHLESRGFADLAAFVEAERKEGAVYPPEEEVFKALEHTPFDGVNVLLLGQDPYHGPGQAHGISFSVAPGVVIPPSLANMFKELATDVGFRAPDNGSLLPWADQGVLLLNAVLTVRAGAAGSHANKGWEVFTDAVIRALDARERPVVFVLWGNYAKKKAKLIDAKRHRVIEGVHPSPLSAHAGFFGSKPFTAIDTALRSLGHAPMQWQLPDAGVPIVKAPRAAAKKMPEVVKPRAAITEATATAGASIALDFPKNALHMKGDWLWVSPSSRVFVAPNRTGFTVRSGVEGPPLREIPAPREAPFPASAQPLDGDDPPHGLQNGAVNDAGDRLALVTHDRILLVDASGKVLRSVSVFAEENDDDGDEDTPEWLGVPHAVAFDLGGKIIWLATLGEGGGAELYALDAKTLALRGHATLLEGVPDPAFIDILPRPGGDGAAVGFACGQDGAGFSVAEWKKKAITLAPPGRWKTNAFSRFSCFADEGRALFVRTPNKLQRFGWGEGTPSAEAPGGLDGPAGMLDGWLLVVAPGKVDGCARPVDVLDPTTLEKHASFTLPSGDFAAVLADGTLLGVARGPDQAMLTAVRVRWA